MGALCPTRTRGRGPDLPHPAFWQGQARPSCFSSSRPTNQPEGRLLPVPTHPKPHFCIVLLCPVGKGAALRAFVLYQGPEDHPCGQAIGFTGTSLPELLHELKSHQMGPRAGFGVTLLPVISSMKACRSPPFSKYTWARRQRQRQEHVLPPGHFVKISCPVPPQSLGMEQAPMTADYSCLYCFLSHHLIPEILLARSKPLYSAV